MADLSGAKAIIAFAVRELTAFRLSGNRPRAPVYIFTSAPSLINQLSIVWGVRAFYIDPVLTVDEAFGFSLTTLKTKQLIRNGDIVLHVSSIPLYDFNGVNTIRLSYV
jgi:pyruvate kinase